MLLNGTGNQHGKERDAREYYGKGKGKMDERAEAKWVRTADRGNKKHYNGKGKYNGEGESARNRPIQQEEAKKGNKEEKERQPMDHSQKEALQVKPAGGDKEEGEISSPQEQSSARASEEFQKALLET